MRSILIVLSIITTVSLTGCPEYNDACASNDACEDGYICKNGDCVDDPAEGEGEGEGEGECVLQTDCNAGQDCINGRCVGGGEGEGEGEGTTTHIEVRFNSTHNTLKLYAMWLSESGVQMGESRFPPNAFPEVQGTSSVSGDIEKLPGAAMLWIQVEVDNAARIDDWLAANDENQGCKPHFDLQAVLVDYDEVFAEPLPQECEVYSRGECPVTVPARGCNALVQ